MTQSLSIAISGASGRMGLALIRALAAHPQLRLAAAGLRPGAEDATKRALELAGLAYAIPQLTTRLEALVDAADAVIDFSAPEHALHLAGLCAAQGKSFISGTTGLSAAQRDALKQLGTQTRIVWSANMSVGVNLLMGLVEQTAGLLGPEADIEIVEMHHRHKVDAPSGTALALGEAAAHGRQVALNDVAVRSRDGHTGARKPGEIGFATLRGGDVIGDHTVIFAMPGERIELSHKSTTRDIFANGALVAAVWAAGRANGFYSMRDVVKA